jgi:hypothetical protein
MKLSKKIWIFFLIITFLAGIFAIMSISQDFSFSNNTYKEGNTSMSPDPSATPAPSATPDQNAITLENNTIFPISNTYSSTISPGSSSLAGNGYTLPYNGQPSISPSCPDTLIQNGKFLLLYTSGQPIGNGTNPIVFANLDEYKQYVNEQKSKGINCPVLYLQQENNAQGKDVYRIRPSPFDLQGGLPASLPTNFYANQNQKVVNVLDASRENGQYNSNQYPGFDPYGLYTGVYTNLDKIHDSTALGSVSDNPMDANWGGVMYSNNSVLSGKYDMNNIYKPLLFQPKVQYDSNSPRFFNVPKDVIQ